LNLLELQHFIPPFTPAEQLAADETLLDHCEAGQIDETLLFWEPRETFVVVGYANKVTSEVNVPACEARQIPIFRRCSGGGTVVQIPGGLNYSLILRITENSPTQDVTSANRFIMEKNRAAIQTLVPDTKIAVRGYTDLVIHDSVRNDVKFAGNSQRRRKQFLLFHGTLLLNCDLNLIGELLPMPSLRPDYRADRPHAEFVTNLNLPADAVKDALAKEWNATSKLADLPLEEIQKLARDRYATREWNFKF
jgi:lipoate-protein ligase A